ncbi:MAG: Crp/Fnr family transcriptional regulator [Parasporobacterium sp.]|nr:Crp/Fnr family transcriptional regulator [Parasporobacterium sp.]
MKRTYDKRKIQAALEQTGLNQCLKTIDPGIMICDYAPGELVISPLKPSQNILFLLEGDASVYILDDNGTMLVAARERPGGMIGDPELFLENYQSVYVEARTGFRVLALPYELCLREIRINERFTHFLIRQILLREGRKREIDYTGDTREKVLFYIRNICPNQCTPNITGIADTVHCSYRQVQRIVSDLCEEGILVRIGKGKYRLN